MIETVCFLQMTAEIRASPHTFLTVHMYKLIPIIYKRKRIAKNVNKGVNGFYHLPWTRMYFLSVSHCKAALLCLSKKVSPSRVNPEVRVGGDSGPMGSTKV
jgi:hypothetical protein